MPARPFAWAARCFCRLRHLRTASSSRQNCSETNLPAVVMLSKRSSEMNPSACSRSAFNPATRSMYSGNLPAAGVNSKMTAIIGPPSRKTIAEAAAGSGHRPQTAEGVAQQREDRLVLDFPRGRGRRFARDARGALQVRFLHADVRQAHRDAQLAFQVE